MNPLLELQVLQLISNIIFLGKIQYSFRNNFRHGLSLLYIISEVVLFKRLSSLGDSRFPLRGARFSVISISIENSLVVFVISFSLHSDSYCGYTVIWRSTRRKDGHKTVFVYRSASTGNNYRCLPLFGDTTAHKNSNLFVDLKFNMLMFQQIASFLVHTGNKIFSVVFSFLRMKYMRILLILV
jgi:hypothetical protein